MEDRRKSGIASFFTPKSVSILGASTTPGKLGTLVLKNMIAQGYTGQIYPINPNISEAFGIKCYPSVSELPVEPNLSVILVAAYKVPQALIDHAKRGIKKIIIMSAGFKEIGVEGERLEREISQIANEHQIRVIGPNCLGIYDNVSMLDTFFIPRDLIERPAKGGVSLASQSGSFVGHLMDLCSFEHVGIARALTYGNKVDVNEVDALYYFANDPETKVVGLYIEGVTDGREFLKAAEYCTAKKPVVVLKTGKYDSAQRALTSHTRAIAGSYMAYKSAFRRARFLEVESETEFIDSLKVITSLPRAHGKRVLILGHSGGLGLTLADKCLSLGLEVPETDEDLYRLLRTETLSFASMMNPIDLTASGTDDHARFVLEKAFVNSDFADICIYLALWGLPQSSDEIGSILSTAMTKSRKPIVVATLEGKKCMEKRGIFESSGIPVFFSLERAAIAAKHLVDLKQEA